MTDNTNSPPLTEYVLLLILAFLWGGAFTLIKVALESYPPLTIVAFRIAIGGLILLMFALARRDTFPKSGKRWGELLIQGMLQGAIPFFLISWGEKYIDSSVAGIVNSTPPMFVFLFTVFLLRKTPFDMLKFIGILLGLAGVVLISNVQYGGLEDMSGLAVLAVLGASASYATGAIFGHRFSDQSVFITASCSLICAAIVMVPLSYIVDAPLTLEPALRPTLALLGLTLFSTALASLIFFRLIKTLGALATTSNAYLRALFSILLGVLFLAEPFTWLVVGSTLLIFMGVFMVTGQYRRLVVDKLFVGSRHNHE